jgi:predicted nucleic acid-binding protein
VANELPGRLCHLGGDRRDHLSASIRIHLIVSHHHHHLAGECAEADRQLWNTFATYPRPIPTYERSEFRKVVQKISLENAIEAIAKAEDLLRDREYEISSITVLALSHRSGASAYDCEFVVLAQQFGIPLLTTDRKLKATFPETAV